MKAVQVQRKPENLARAWRECLQAQQAQLRTAFEQNADTARLLRQHCRLVDALLRDVWQQSGLAAEVCLIAVGGYGRGELFPYSDVDLLILLPGTPDKQLQCKLEELVPLFWDLGLEIGH